MFTFLPLLFGVCALPTNEVEIRNIATNVSGASSKIGRFLGLSKTVNIEQIVVTTIKIIEYIQDGTAIYKAAKNGDVTGVVQIITDLAATEFPEYSSIIRLSGDIIAKIIVQFVQSK